MCCVFWASVNSSSLSQGDKLGCELPPLLGIKSPGTVLARSQTWQGPRGRSVQDKREQPTSRANYSPMSPRHCLNKSWALDSTTLHIPWAAFSEASTWDAIWWSLRWGQPMFPQRKHYFNSFLCHHLVMLLKKWWVTLTVTWKVYLEGFRLLQSWHYIHFLI